MLPKVVIVGRPNVGKSSLFNMLAGRRVSIVDPTPGITRDRVGAVIALTPSSDSPGQRPCFVELIDTGGHGIEDVQNLTAEVERQIALALGEASIIMFVVDAQCGLTLLDEQVAELLRTAEHQREVKRVVLTANKVDGAEHEPGALEATRFGFGVPIMVSATSAYGKHDLIEVLYQRITRLEDEGGNLETVAEPPEQGVLIAIVGKRNSGKSTLVNTLAGEPRVIVSETEGTTRDAIDVRFEIDGRVFTAIDTAGVRRRKSLGDDIAYYSYHRSLRSIRRADVVLCLIDATVPVSQVDRQLGNELLRQYKPTVIVVNKWDLAEARHTQDEYVTYLDDALKGINFAPIAFISARRGQGVREAVAMAMNLYRQAGHRVPTGRLNQAMKEILSERTPTAKSGHRPRIYYVSQLDNHPPTIGLWVNHPDMFDNTYQRFLLNRLRDHMPWSEVPIKLLIRGKNRLPEEAMA